MTDNLPLTIDNASGEILDPAAEDRLADHTAQQVFGSDDNVRDTMGLIARFMASYEARSPGVPLEVWLADRFRDYPTLWSGEEEITATAREVIASVERANADKQSLYAHLDAGKSRESWLAKRMETGAAAAGTAEVGAYASRIETTLDQANAQMLDALLKKTPDPVTGNPFNMCPNLDGFIAEQHHAHTFNLDAVAKGSPLRAKVLTPEPGQPYGKNSMDIGIYDGDRLVRRYQAKYGQDADATLKLFDKGDYRGQRKLVPAEQVDDIAKGTDVLEMDGVRSKPLTKAEAKALQEQVQQQQEVRQYAWNDVNRIEIARRIGKQAMLGAAVTACFQGGRILARRAWNALCGKENPPASADLKEFFESSLKSAAHVGVQVAVSGAVVVAAKNGWIKVLQGTPAGRIANMVYVGMENAKVLWKLAKGELTAAEALDAMGNTTCSALGGLAGAAEGAAIGLALGGPVGAFVGGVVGGMAGSKIGEAVYEGGKAIVKTAVAVVKTVWEGVKDTARAVGRILNPLTWFA